MTSWGVIEEIGAEGAIVKLASGTRQKPMQLPKGAIAAVGDNVLVEKLSNYNPQREIDAAINGTASEQRSAKNTGGKYIIVQIYGG